MVSRSVQSTELQSSLTRPGSWAERTSAPEGAVYERPASLTASALAFAVRCHAGQLRDSDGALFIQHPLEVARLLRNEGAPAKVVAAGLLHEVLVGDTSVSPTELKVRFGATVASLVQAVSDTTCDGSYRQRMQVLREQVRSARGDAALLFAADSLSNVRELADQVDRDRGRLWHSRGDRGAGARLQRYHDMRLEHCHESLGMLQSVAARHPLVEQLADELDEFPAFSA